MLFFESKKKIHTFLNINGADAIPHVKRKTFHDHLSRVGDMLTAWGLDDTTVNAGLCHSLYSTEAFDKVILGLNQRSELRAVIGSEAEELVFHFCSMKRDTLQLKEDAHFFSYRVRSSGLPVDVTREQGIALLHILFANEIDHIHEFNVNSMSAFLTHRYAAFASFFAPKAAGYFASIRMPSRFIPKHTDYVRFTGHAGIHIQTQEHSLVIDPWFYSSTRERPRLQGLDPESSTIDFMVPEPRNTILEIAPDIVLLSHFHTHHAPFDEIKEIAEIKRITVVCPPLPQERLNEIRKRMGDEIFGNITFVFVVEDVTLTFGQTTVRVLTHTKPNHVGYFVASSAGSIFHLSDPHASNSNSLLFDPMWEKFNGLNPDYAFISCAGHAQRRILKTGTRIIMENQTFSPTQAAKFAVKIGAKNAGAVGIFNYSLWTDRVEFTPSSEEIEREFHWALSFLSPSIQILTLRPGNIHYFDI